MKKRLPAAALALFCAATPAIAQQIQNDSAHIIAVARTGTVYAKRDLAILTLAIQSSAPFAADALSENARKVKEVETSLAALGYSSSEYKVTSVSITKAGGPFFGPGQPAISGNEASQFVYVFFEDADLQDPDKLTQKAGAAIDALAKVGALPSYALSPPFIEPQQAEGTLLYTVKDPGPYEREAVQKALAAARDEAQAIAQQMGVKITGLTLGMTGYSRTMPEASLTDLPYKYYSTESDGVKISQMANLHFGIQ
jgi:uncharacterized protein YggE